MALVNAYCTVAEVRDHLSDTGSKLDSDVLEAAINAASRAIDRFCGRKFWLDATATVRTYRPDDSTVAWVDDIGTTTGLVIKTDTASDATFATTWAATDYQLEPLNGGVATGEPYAYWRIHAIDDERFIVAPHRATLQVTAKFGWSEVPDDIVYAATLKSVALFKRRDAPFGVAGFGTFGAVRISRRDPDVMELLEPYMRLSVGAV